MLADHHESTAHLLVTPQSVDYLQEAVPKHRALLAASLERAKNHAVKEALTKGSDSWSSMDKSIQSLEYATDTMRQVDAAEKARKGAVEAPSYETCVATALQRHALAIAPRSAPPTTSVSIQVGMPGMVRDRGDRSWVTVSANDLAVTEQVMLSIATQNMTEMLRAEKGATGK